MIQHVAALTADASKPCIGKSDPLDVTSNKDRHDRLIKLVHSTVDRLVAAKLIA